MSEIKLPEVPLDYDCPEEHINNPSCKEKRPCSICYLEAEANRQLKEILKGLYEDVICPMCYRLNPQHADMYNGEGKPKGCHWCQERASYTGEV